MSIETEIIEFKDKTGIDLPKDFVELYLEKGNGGFGPDYGFLGIVNGHKTDLGDSMLTLYLSFLQPDEEDSGWHWPRQYIPFIDIGCAIHYCIDTSKESCPVVKFDPNGYGPGENLSAHFYRTSSSFKQWLKLNAQKA